MNPWPDRRSAMVTGWWGFWLSSLFIACAFCLSSMSLSLHFPLLIHPLLKSSSQKEKRWPENQHLFLDPSENWGHKATLTLKIGGMRKYTVYQKHESTAGASGSIANVSDKLLEAQSGLIWELKIPKAMGRGGMGVLIGEDVYSFISWSIIRFSRRRIEKHPLILPTSRGEKTVWLQENKSFWKRCRN